MENIKPKLLLLLLAASVSAQAGPPDRFADAQTAAPSDTQHFVAKVDTKADANGASDVDDYWRRTKFGWEWLEPTSRDETRFLALHPLTVAAFILLGSLLGLLWHPTTGARLKEPEVANEVIKETKEACQVADSFRGVALSILDRAIPTKRTLSGFHTPAKMDTRGG